MSSPFPFGQPTTLLFLVGSAHTGKTELGAAFRENSGALVVRGAHFWRSKYAKFGSLKQEESLRECARRLAADEYLRRAGVDQNRLIDLARAADHTYGGLFLLATVEAACRLENLASAPDTLVIQVGGLEGMAVAVAGELGNAAFLHTIRDPRRYFGTREDRRRVGHLGWRLASWSASANVALSNVQELGHRYLVIRGEDLIESPDQVSAQISVTMGLELTLREAGRSLTVKGDPLSGRPVKVVERLVGRQLEALGYAVDRSAFRVMPSRAALDAGAYHIRSRLALRPGGHS